MEEYCITVVEKHLSEDGTVKFLIRLHDGNLIETVFMSHDYGGSVCVSSQAGCSMGCRFCASGITGKERNLTAEEMLAQVMLASCCNCIEREGNSPDGDSESESEREIGYLGYERGISKGECARKIEDLGYEKGSRKNKVEIRPSKKVTHIVIMGTGEPFDNFDEVIRFCDIISDEKKLKMLAAETTVIEAAPIKAAEAIVRGTVSSSFRFHEQSVDGGIVSGHAIQPVAPRHITVSTCGIIPRIFDFAKTQKRYNLAISLHAPDNELRDKLMPVNRRYPLEELIPAAREYCRITKRRVTFEYILLEGVNDTEEHALKLVHLLNGSSRVQDNCLAAVTNNDQNPGNEDSKKEKNEMFYVNLIPYNQVNEFGYKGSSKETALKFYDILMRNGIRATLRKERGSDIAAACGQLRVRH